MDAGLRADYQWASDGTPFFLRPYIKLRGVEAMRYQGDEMASAEVEARWQVRGRWSLVGAAGYGTAHTDRELYSATRDVVSGAVGFRYELARKFGCTPEWTWDSARVRLRSISRSETPGSGRSCAGFSCSDSSRKLNREGSSMKLRTFAAAIALAALAVRHDLAAGYNKKGNKAIERPSPATGAPPKPSRATPTVIRSMRWCSGA